MNFVLIHGGFHGGWCWRLVAQRLRAQGHHVTHPTQTGLGERRHLASNSLTLEIFIQDVVNHLVTEDLRDVVLVGHSFGGIAISGAAERVPERICQLVYLDSLIVQPGQTPYETLPPEVMAQRRQGYEVVDGVRGFAPPPVSVFGIPEDHPEAAWVRLRLSVARATTREPLRHIPAARPHCSLAKRASLSACEHLEVTRLNAFQSTR